MIFRPIFWIVCCFILGIITAKFLVIPVYIGLIASIFFFICACIFNNWRKLFWSFCAAFIFTIGFSYSNFWIQKKIIILPAGAVDVQGTIIDIPYITTSNYKSQVRQRLTLKARIKYEDKERYTLQKIIVSLPFNTQNPLRYGDLVELKGNMIPIFARKNPGNFDAQNYYKNSGISGKLSVKNLENVTLLKRDQANPILLKIFKTKEFFSNLIIRHVPGQHSALVNAMLLGQRQDLSESFKEAFSKSGTAHIISISGTHVSIIALILLSLLKLFPIGRKPTYILTVILLWIYCILVGAASSIMRSTFMISIYLLGFVLSRRSEGITCLSWAAFLILLFNPLQIFDAGFQLSFITVLFLISSSQLKIFTPENKEMQPAILQTWKEKLKIKLTSFWRWLALSVSISFIAWAALVPVVSSYFYMNTPISILANLIIIPLSSALLAASLAFLILGSFSLWAAKILGSAVWILSASLFKVADFFAQVPFGNFRCAPFDYIDYLIYYFPLLLWLFKSYWNWNIKRWCTIVLICLNLLVWKGFFWTNAPQNLRITFLDVGHGDAALIEFPRKGTLLVDCGMGGAFNQGQMTIAPFLWQRGITRLDGIIITHPHLDHYGGLSALLKEFKVSQVFDNGARDNIDYNDIFKNRDIKRCTLTRGDQLQGANLAQMQVIHPPQTWVENSLYPINDQSIVFSLKYGAQTILFAGDAEDKTMLDLMQNYSDLRADILKAPHHGSFEPSASTEFFSQVRPQISILSEAQHNIYRLPSPKTINALQALNSKIYQTGFSGAVTIETDGAQIQTKTELGL